MNVLFGVAAVVAAGALLGAGVVAGVLIFGPETVLEHW